MTTATTTTITGNLTRDPEIRYTRDGQATTTLGVAVNRRWQNRDTNEWEESTSFFDVVTWRDLAENVALSLTRGMRVVVTGRLEQRSWETDEGDRRFKVEIVADEVGASLRFATVDVHKAAPAGGRTRRGRPGLVRRRPPHVGLMPGSRTVAAGADPVGEAPPGPTTSFRPVGPPDQAARSSTPARPWPTPTGCWSPPARPPRRRPWATLRAAGGPPGPALMAGSATPEPDRLRALLGLVLD